MVFRELAGLPAMMRQPEVDDNLREVFRSQSMRNLLNVKSWGPKRFASEQAAAAAAASGGNASGASGSSSSGSSSGGGGGADVERPSAGGGARRTTRHRASGSFGGEADAAGSLASSSAMVVVDGGGLSSSSGGAATAAAAHHHHHHHHHHKATNPISRGLARVRKALGSPVTRGEKAACGVFWALFAGGILTLFVWGFPQLVDKGIKPAITAVKTHLTPVQIAAVVFFGYVIVPCSFFVGPNSFIWMAGLCFPFWQSVLLIEAASCVGVLVPFFLGRTVLRRSAARLLARSKPMQVAVRAVDESGPWKVLAIIRLGPIPYAW
jgi:hypothetical protein